VDDEGDRLHLDAVYYFYFPVRPKWNHRYQGLVSEEATVTVLIRAELCDEDFFGVLNHREDRVSPLLLKSPDKGPQYSLSIQFAVVKA
jgi:hypothetical protein